MPKIQPTLQAYKKQKAEDRSINFISLSVLFFAIIYIAIHLVIFFARG